LTGGAPPPSDEPFEANLLEADKLRRACEPPIEEFLQAAEDLAAPVEAWLHEAGDLRSNMRQAALRVLAARRWLQHAQDGYAEQVLQESSDDES
jgi:hypothetical protein